MAPFSSSVPRHLKPLQTEGFLRLPYTPEDCGGNAHLFYLLLDELSDGGETRDALLAFLNERGIQAVFHYVPLHSSPMDRAFGYAAGDLPVTERVSRCLLRLPIY